MRKIKANNEWYNTIILYAIGNWANILKLITGMCRLPR
jgi:hypothetical protein